MSRGVPVAVTSLPTKTPNRDTSFFVYLSFYAVHGPIQTSQEKWNKYRTKAEEMGIAESGFIMERRLPIRQKQDNPIYAGLLESMDEAIGMVLDCLEENGLDDNTIVVFTSDNGGVSSGDNFSTSNLPLRGGKGYQWEGGIKEPYFIKVPWMDVAGNECPVPVTGADFYPTLLDLTGTPLRPEQHKDGVSLLPLLEGRRIADRPLFWHYPHYGNQGGDPSSIIREGDWKLIHYWEDENNTLNGSKKQELSCGPDLRRTGWISLRRAGSPMWIGGAVRQGKSSRYLSTISSLQSWRKKILHPGF